MKTSDWRREKYPILFESKDEENDWDFFRDEDFWKAIRALKKECIEKCKQEKREIIYDFSEIHFPNFEYLSHDHVGFNPVQFWERKESHEFKNKTHFNSAHFYQNVDFIGVIFHQNVDFIGVIFHQNVDFGASEFRDNADFYGAEFRESADFTYASAKIFRALDSHFFKSAKFDYAVFQKAHFNRECYFGYFSCTHAIFEESYFNGAVIKNANRDAFRIIKKSFDNQGDYINANKYYSREMSAYEKELEGKWATHFEDKIVFYLGKAISNFSQSWLQPLAWIICWSVFLYLFQSLHNGILSNQISFSEFFQFINPFETNYTNGEQIIYGWWLLHKIGLSFLLYHFVVALRRQMRR